MTLSVYDKNGIKTALNGLTIALNKSLSIDGGKLDGKVTLIDKSYGDGSVKIGTTGYKNRKLNLTSEVTFETDSDARAYLNSVFIALSNAVKLYDETNGLLADISLASLRVQWKDGCLLRYGTLTAELTMLDPMWNRAVTPSEYEVTGGVPLTIEVTNNGASDALFSLTVDVAEQETAASFSVANETNSLVVESPRFGLDGYTRLIVDTAEGSITTTEEGTTVSADELGSVEEGTGFFRIPVGISYIQVSVSVSATVTLAIVERVMI